MEIPNSGFRGHLLLCLAMTFPTGQMDVPLAGPEGAQKGKEQKQPWLGRLDRSPLRQGWRRRSDGQAKDATPSLVGHLRGRAEAQEAQQQGHEPVLGASPCPRTVAVAPSQTEAGEGRARGDLMHTKPPPRNGFSAAWSTCLRKQKPGPVSLPPSRLV